MGLAGSTYHDVPTAADKDAETLARIKAVGEEFEAYGYRRIRAELRHQGLVVNSKRVRRLMREHDLQPRRRRRYTATTDSDHDEPLFENKTPGVTLDGPNQLWVADMTYVTVLNGFVYVAVILNAWSRRAIGYAISRSIRYPACSGSAERRHRSQESGQGLCTPQRSWASIREYRLPQGAGRPSARRLHKPSSKPLRQRQGRELHEDAEGRGRLPDGVRDVCRRRR